jgi:flagellar biosynthesis protein FliR
MIGGFGFALVLARTAGFLFRAPGFSHPSVPPPLRAGFAAAFALALAAPYARRAGTFGNLFADTLVLGLEALIGATIGAGASVLYDGAYAGGRALDDYVGIRASVPSANVSAGAGFGRLWSLAFSTGFFTLGGDALALFAFADSFRAVGPGALARASDLATFAVALPATLARAAIFVAGPALALALIVQLTLAVIARVVPRFSTFSLAFGVVYSVVLVATLAALPIALGAAATPWLDLSPLGKR